MGAFDRFWKRERSLKKTIEIDNTLYEKLGELAKNVYQTSINQLINACIEELIKTNNVKIIKIQSVLYQHPEKLQSSSIKRIL